MTTKTASVLSAELTRLSQRTEDLEEHLNKNEADRASLADAVSAVDEALTAAEENRDEEDEDDEDEDEDDDEDAAA